MLLVAQVALLELGSGAASVNLMEVEGTGLMAPPPRLVQVVVPYPSLIYFFPLGVGVESADLTEISPRPSLVLAGHSQPKRAGLLR